MLAIQAPSLPAEIPRTQSFGAPPIPPPFSQIEDIPPPSKSLRGSGGLLRGGGSYSPHPFLTPYPSQVLNSRAGKPQFWEDPLVPRASIAAEHP